MLRIADSGSLPKRKRGRPRKDSTRSKVRKKQALFVTATLPGEERQCNVHVN